MKTLIFHILVVCNYGKEGVLSSYYLLNGTRADVGSQCSGLNGNITNFQSNSSTMLIQILREANSIQLWNGYQYTSGWIENTGCFHRIKDTNQHKLIRSDITVSYCEHYCRQFGTYSIIALKESECLCLTDDRDSQLFFNASNPNHCTYRCNMRQEEHCGSTEGSNFYNIYSARAQPPNISFSGNGFCLSYKWNKTSGLKLIRAKNCNGTMSTTLIACRSNTESFVTERNREPKTWMTSLDMCLTNYSSYLVSYSDAQNESFPRAGKIWLNERKYQTTVENLNARQNVTLCQIISKETNGSIRFEIRNCTDNANLQYVCKTGNFDKKTTSKHENTSTAQQTTTKSIVSTEMRTATLTSPQLVTSDIFNSPITADENNKGIVSTEMRTATLTSPQLVTSDIFNSPITADENNKGSIIGGTLGAVLVAIVIVAIIVVFIVRKRDKKESEYQSQKVKFSKSNGITNSAYCAEATFDIIQGNPDRISQEYTTIKDEDIQNYRVSNSVRNTIENKSQMSPSNEPLYSVLEKTDSKSEINSLQNYELAKPISDKEGNEHASLHPEGREQKEEAMDYDHLRQEAYKQNMAEENVYNHADTDNDYSHISQVTKTNKTHTDDDDDDNDYDHTGNVQNHDKTSNKVNDKYDTYAHACGDGRTVKDQTDDDDDDDYAHTQTKETHHQTSMMRIDQDDTYAHAVGDGTTADGMRDIGPYDLAQNVRRPDDDSKEYSDNIRGIGSYEVAHNVNRPDVDDQESSNDMREIGPYAFAHNIDRRENGATESPQDTFVQLGTEEGNYSLAEPIDMNDSGQYE